MGQEQDALRRIRRDEEVEGRRKVWKDSGDTGMVPLRRPLDEQIADLRTVILDIEEVRTRVIEKVEEKA